MNALVRDLADSLRRLRRSPGFALAASGVLALGIASTTALFALVRGVVLRPLPYSDPGRLVVLVEDTTAANGRNWPTSIGRVEDYNAASRSFEGGVAASRTLDAVLATEGGGGGGDGSIGNAERVAAARVTGNLFSVLGVEARLGRALTAADALPGAPPVVVLGDGLWRRRFAADASVIGRTVAFDGVQRTVVGVAPASFAWPQPTTELWVPFVPSEAERNRALFYLRAVARLAPGVERSAAEAELVAVAEGLDLTYPDTETGTRPRLVPMHDDLLGEAGRALWMLQGAVLLLLVVAAANFASLLLARGAAREGELAVRAAIGGSRVAIVRLQVVEGLVLGALGAAGGIALGAAALAAALAAAGSSLPRAHEVHLDLAVIAVSIAGALLVGALGALPPAFAATSRSAAGTLRAAGRGGSGRRQRWLTALVVFEIAVTTVLAAGGALLASSLARLAATDSGVETAGVVTIEVGQPPGASSALPDQARYLRRMLERVRESPGLERASALSRLPVVGQRAATGYEVEGRPNPLGQAPVADLRWIEPGALPVLGVPFERGRDIAEGDTESAPFVVLVNRAFARLQFPDGDALGKRIFVGNERQQWREIVGVVGDVHLTDLEKPVEPTIWAPFTQTRFPTAMRASAVVVKSPLPPAEALQRLRAAIASFDALQAPTKPRTLEEAIAGSLAPQRFRAGLFSAFAALASLLAASGIYGLTAYSVAQRKQELGVRLALGARAATLARLVLGQAARLGGWGIAAGLVGAIASGKLLSAWLFATSSWEPSVLAPVVLVVGATALVASLAPALRAARIPPSRALRDL